MKGFLFSIQGEKIMDYSIMGKKLKEVRDKSGLTMEEFGRLFGAGRVTVSRWEKGKKVPDLDTLIKISEKFNRPIDFFVKEEFPSKDLLEALGYDVGFKKGYAEAIENVKVNINKVFFNM